MMQKRFIGIVWKSGNSHVITIPNDRIKHGIIKPEKEYLVTLKEVQDEELETAGD